MTFSTLILSLSLFASQAVTSTLTPELQSAIEAQPHTMHRVFAVMDTRMTLSDFTGRVENLPRGVRQRFVMNELRAFADQSQAEILNQLSWLEEQGHVNRVEQIWLNNCIQFRADAEALHALEKIDGVSHIQIDPIRNLDEYTDASLQLPATYPNPQVGTAQTTYYFEDFESGTFGPEWSNSTTGCGRVRVSSQFNPFYGNYHALIDSNSDACDSTAWMMVEVDMSGVTTAQLRFGFQDMNDEYDPGADIFEISNDGGATWVTGHDMTGTNLFYEWVTIDLDKLGITYTADMRFRWSWKDNYMADTDGFGIDNFEVADTFPPPPPPDPEPNLVQLQATSLWDVGITGQGAVLLNIDSGVDRTHPDLRNRIWQNPNDPLDGIDNDGNGYTDDVWGWDFENNDNDPDPGSATHGTQTGGIMVGDGTAGVKITGMAPGAQMAVARVAGESDHWLAQQWGISVAVDCSSSSHSYKWYFSPKPDYHMHRVAEDIVLAAGIIHANSIGNSGGSSSSPIPWQISAPGVSPAPWRHPDQTQTTGGVSGLLACGGIELDNTYYSYSSLGPATWEDIDIYSAGYPHSQDPNFWDYSIGGWSGTGQGLLKPDLVTYTNVQSTYNGGGYASFGGTSAATPHLGGSLALMVSANQHARPKHIAEALMITAKDMGSPGKDNKYGAGRVQVFAAALRVIGLLVPLDLEPQMGQPTTLELSGPANMPWRVYYGMSRGTTTVPGVGNLEIDNASMLAQGSLNANGEFMLTQTVPNNPGLIDRTVYLQMATDVSSLGGAWLYSLVEEVTIRP